MWYASTSPPAAINTFLYAGAADFEAFIFQSVLPDWFLRFGGRKWRKLTQLYPYMHTHTQAHVPAAVETYTLIDLSRVTAMRVHI